MIVVGKGNLGSLRDEVVAQSGWDCIGACVRGPSHGSVALNYRGLRDELLTASPLDQRDDVAAAFDRLEVDADARAAEVRVFQQLAKDVGIYARRVDGDWGDGSEGAWTHIVPTSTGRRSSLSDARAVVAWSGGTMSIAQAIAVAITRDEWLALSGVPELPVPDREPVVPVLARRPSMTLSPLPFQQSEPTPEPDAVEGDPLPPSDSDDIQGATDDWDNEGTVDVGASWDGQGTATAPTPEAEAKTNWVAWTAVIAGVGLAGTGLVLWLRQRRRLAPATAGLAAFTHALSPSRRVMFRWQQDWPKKYVSATVDPTANLVSFREQRRRLSYDYPASRMFGTAYLEAVKSYAAEQMHQRRLRRKGLAGFGSPANEHGTYVDFYVRAAREEVQHARDAMAQGNCFQALNRSTRAENMIGHAWAHARSTGTHFPNVGNAAHDVANNWGVIARKCARARPGA